MVMRGMPLPAVPMDEWTGCREPAYITPRLDWMELVFLCVSGVVMVN